MRISVHNRKRARTVLIDELPEAGQAVSDDLTGCSIGFQAHTDWIRHI